MMQSMMRRLECIILKNRYGVSEITSLLLLGYLASNYVSYLAGGAIEYQKIVMESYKRKSEEPASE